MAEEKLLKEQLSVDQLARIAGGIGTSEADIQYYLNMLAYYKNTLKWTKDQILNAVKPRVTEEQYATVVKYLDEHWDEI